MSTLSSPDPLAEVFPRERVVWELDQRRRVHLVGIGGPGMSAIAIALAEMGHIVSGSDIRERQILDRLRASGVEIHIGHNRQHVHDADVVTYSTAIPADINELDEARKRGIPTVHRSEVLGALCRQTNAYGVAGTHGKTTTSSMLMLILAAAGREPGFVIGGDVADVGTGARWSDSGSFVVEADESDGTHLRLPLAGTVLTNVDVDHLDNYGTFDAIVEGFERYVDAVDGPVVIGVDCDVARRLCAARDVVTFGVSEGADYRVVDIQPQRSGNTFAVERRGEVIARVDLPLRGLHNVLNATGALALAVELGVAPEVAAESLGTFGGVARRFDVRGNVDGATLVDDYAHLPAEIEAVLASTRESAADWSRVVAVFQPNRFNRMSEISDQYAMSFRDADVVVITDIYSSGTQPIPGVTGKLVVNAVLEALPQSRVVWMPKRDALVKFLASELRSGDLCLSMGCGDIATLPDEILMAKGVREESVVQ
ncbi:MAG: UDP-N-acetylmuramate--L-alanine ligase [Ilumatobacteraceae bacterium]